MDLTAPPQWTGGDLRRFGSHWCRVSRSRRLGRATATSSSGTRSFVPRCPLTSSSKSGLRARLTPLDVSSRPKTLATITDKLSRMSTSLDRVQDLAGVRIDSDFLLSEQDAFAKELADYFGRLRADKVKVKDIRDSPHSGYRAIHNSWTAQGSDRASKTWMKVTGSVLSKWRNSSPQSTRSKHGYAARPPNT